MKLRKIGNSFGTTFTRDMLSHAGITEEHELEVFASPGEITIRRKTAHVLVEFNLAEAKALAEGKLDTKAAESAINKVRRLIIKE